jgi:gamma-glutamyltranspeptidase / glutathione hydrolase
LTTTINRIFGAQLTTRHGIVLNDELDDFTASAHLVRLGLSDNPNRARPGARPVSSMSPTLVFKDGQPVMALGGSGGMAIAGNVLQVLLGKLVFNLEPPVLVSQPRFFVPLGKSTLRVAQGASEQLVLDLESRGEVVEQGSLDMSAVQLLVRQGAGFESAADPRKFGSALAR